MNRRAVLGAAALLPLSAWSQRMNAIPKEAEERKRRSIVILQRERIPVNEQLPVIETVAEVKPRAKDEVVTRAFALTIVAEKGATKDHSLAQRMTKAFGVADGLTPKERMFVNNPKPSERDYIQFSWRYEGFGILLWALRFLPNLAKPAEPFKTPELARTLIDLGPQEFRRKATLRPIAQILDEADLIYRYHWAVTDARINGRSSPGQLNGSVVYERHYALNWLVRYMDQEWDDVSTDT
jgi:hypothetical protein